MTKKHASSFVCIALAGLISFVAGAGGCDETEEALECADVCTAYRNCFDQSYDIGACESRCESRSDNTANYRAAVDSCEDCIGVNSCLSTTFNCPTCATIVP